MQLSNEINQFASLVQQGIAAWVQAGELLLTMLEGDPTVVDRICDANPWLTPEIVAMADAVSGGGGRGSLTEH